MSEFEKMINGEIYNPSDEYLAGLRAKSHKLSRLYNQIIEDDKEARRLLNELIPNKGKNLYMESPIMFDYGINTYFGDNCYTNFNFICLDVCKVKIGNNVLFGPNVTIATPLHPLVAEERNIREKEDGSLYDYEYARPITIEDNCWIASNVVICGGVTIGHDSVIGAGSVVTRDIEPNSLAFGNPCKVIRKITEKDKIGFNLK